MPSRRFKATWSLIERSCIIFRLLAIYVQLEVRLINHWLATMAQQSQEYTQKRPVLAPNSYREGKWLPEEHAAFLKANQLYKKNWDMISHLVQTRSPSQVRSHAQKYYNKEENDRTKIGTQQIKPEQDYHMVRTRLNRKNDPNLSKSLSDCFEDPECLSFSIQIPKPIKKNEKKKLGSSPKRKHLKHEPEGLLLRQNQEGLETQISEHSDQSFFMEKIFPKLGTCPLREFSLFTLIELEQFKPASNADSPTKRSRRSDKQ